jgi:hypothetical protein
MTMKLPPTPRDLDIHRLGLIERVSTRAIAEKYGISQTRVRQIIYRVCDWLAQTLPVKTEARKEQETNLAQHLAAAQLNHQIEQLQILWDQTFNPKYLRQQTRIITALARLGTIPGAIDALAADITEGPLSSRHTPCAVTESRNDLDTCNLVTRVPPGDALPRGSSLAESPTTSTTTAGAAPPPFEDCSPETNSDAAPTESTAAQPAPTTSPPTLSDDELASLQQDIKGLNVLERRLLIVLQNDFSENPDERQGIEAYLTQVRQSRAAIELRIAPHIVGASLRLDVPAPDAQPLIPDAVSINA